MICEAPSTLFPLAALQLALYGFAHQIGPIFALATDSIHAIKSAFFEPGDHILRPSFFASHRNYFSYEVLTMDKSYDILLSQSSNGASR